ncbi:hypothetical protein [Maribacter sp. 2304DJ31-5]|uniref:hypothetical protein n=1 Tax=Maribacter sp. 2304DJ31-5 TaxID=3386273 RepID=UPI0039BD5F2B
MERISMLIIFCAIFNTQAQNNFPSTGNVEINNASLTIETASWKSSLLTLKDIHYNPDQIYHFQIESDGLKIKQDDNTNYQFKTGGNFIVNNGKVMLGIGNPLFKLHIKNPIGGAALGMERGGKLWRFDIQDSADRLYLGHSDNTALLTFHKNGNVGIGTTTHKTH